MRFSIYLLLLTFSINLGAQNTITGIVTDSDSAPIFFATLAMYRLSDSTIVQTASTDEDGNYELSGIKDESYYIEASMLGYTTSKKNDISFPKDNNTTINLSLATDAQLLETIEIKERRPLLEQHADKLVVNVADNITSLNSNLLDVMKKVPGVIVTGDKIKLAGSSNPTILINGKTTNYMDVESLMKDMPGDNIQKVEIIHQPGAEYDASGTGPIINVILKKNSLFGTSGSVNMGLSKAAFTGFKTGVNLSHYQGNVNINGGLGYRNSKDMSSLIIDRKVIKDTYNQSSEEIDKDNTYRANLALDWDISSKHRIGFQSRYIDHYSNETTTNNTEIDFSNTTSTDLKIETINDDDNSWKLRSINPYYTFAIDTSGQKLEADFNFITYQSTAKNTLTPTELNTQAKLTRLRYNQPGKTKIYVGKLDYFYPFTNALKLQIGAKYSLADLDNDLQSSYEENNNWLEDNSQSNHYLFDETILGGYTKLSYRKDKWAGTLGLRYEDSKSNGMSIGIDTTLNRSISKLFPSASINRDIIKGLTGILSYSYRLERPNYSSLNPFKYALDSYTSERGNPSLNPEFTHSSKFSLAFKGQPFFNIEHKLTNNAIVDVIEQDDSSGEAFKSETNLATKKRFNINLGFPLDFIPHISGFGYFAANRTSYDAPYLDAIYNQSKWDYTFYTSINFTLPWKVNTELSGWYNSGGLEGLIDAEWMYGTSIGFSKRFLDEKLKVSFGIDDPFNRFFYGNVDYSNIDLKINQTWNVPKFNVQVNYKFGNQFIKNKKNRSNSAGEEMRRAGKN